MKYLASILLSVGFLPLSAQEIVINTNNTALVLRVDKDKRLYQTHLGKRLVHENEYALLPQMGEVCISNGNGNYFEPAFHFTNSKGNETVILKYVSHQVKKSDGNSTETVVLLTDSVRQNSVRLFYKAYPKENVIVTHSEIINNDKKPIALKKYASSMLHFRAQDYYLTQFNGDWAAEASITESKLGFGKKMIDSNLGTRANMFASPFFLLSLDKQADENNGQAILGTLGWTGNFRFTFEKDHENKLRVISGINPFNSEYQLKAGETFVTPEFIFTYSDEGTGKASRNLHNWARKYRVKDGEGDRLTLLNNWEATFFDFNEKKIVDLISEAKSLGLDMFLLDDGWFGNKHPRNDDKAGLGDWQPNKKKLPNGIKALTDAAKQQGVKFGLWIEPEMINPKSELMEKHPNWVVAWNDRERYYFRNQLVLDLSNPEVQNYVYDIVDGLLTTCPDIAYFKWDCNSPLTNIYSNYEKEHQSHLFVDYVKGLYKVLDRLKAKYPKIPMMLCSGGGGRTDYEALRYFTEFWASDNTDPIDRLYIQWGFSHIFPAKTICAHVTEWNRKVDLKFKVDVAMMGKMGFDLNFSTLPKADADFCKNAVKAYNGFKDIIFKGDLYRLVSPYSNTHTATMYVDEAQKRAVVFAFDIFPRYSTAESTRLKLQGLQANKMYKVKEINRYDGKDIEVGTFSGDYLMTVGMKAFSEHRLQSRIFLVEE